MDSSYSSELKAVITAVQHAATLTKLVLAAANNNVSHVDKDDLSPVTVADFAVQALLTATLHAAFPGDSFVGEETADDLRQNPQLLASVWALLEDIAKADSSTTAETSNGSSTPGIKIPGSPEHACDLIDLAGRGTPGSGRVWVFDPVDGTKTFLRGGVYAINACLLVDGRQTVAVVGLPNLPPDAKAPITDDTPSTWSGPNPGSILYAVAGGHGAFLRPLPGPADLRGTPLPRLASSSDANDMPLRFVTSTEADSSVPGVHAKVTEKLGMAYPDNDVLAWVARWAVLALGHANVTVWVYAKRQRLAKIWDHAGAMLLYQEVGGKVTDVDGREVNLTAGRKMVENYGWIAAPEGVHGKVLAAVREALKEEGREDLLVPQS